MNCPVCGGEMHPVRNLDQCLRCGWRASSCCEGQACGVPPETQRDTQASPPKEKTRKT